MAGVGFSLNALGNRGGYSGMLQKYGAAGLISCGPWLLSVFSMLLIGALGRSLVSEPRGVERFQVCVTWLFALSLILSGPLQLQLTRFIADRVYARRNDEIAPNLFAALVLMSSLSGLCAVAAAPLFEEESAGFRLLLGVAFVTLSNVWLMVGVMTGLRRHLAVLGVFGLGYLVTLVAALALARYGELGLIGGFALGQAVLLIAGLRLIAEELPSPQPVAWDFIKPRQLRFDLLAIGLFYNLSIWIDKALFWFDSETSRAVVGPLRGSDVYDLPIFLAYLTIVPGMAVFLVRVETDFAGRHAAYYAAVRDGAPLLEIEERCDQMTEAARRAITDLLQVQGLTVVACIGLGPWLLGLFGISALHLPLFNVDTIGVGMQVMLLTATSILFYLDRRREVVLITALLFSINWVATWVSRELGPMFYGYGFGLAMTVTSLTAILILDRILRHLVRDTFMLQPVLSAEAQR
jgi:polysaccharide biosynthesis protein PelG